MKTHSFTVFLGLFFSLTFCGLGQAPTPTALFPSVDIRNIREVKFQKWVFADGVWRTNWPCLRLDLWTTAELKSDFTVGKAYFFDNDRKLLSAVDKIPEAEHVDGSYGLPPVLKAHTDIDVYVPIETKDKEGKWRSVVFVFGDPEKLSAQVYPRRDGITWDNFDFPEREKLIQQAQAAQPAKRSPLGFGSASTLVPPARPTVPRTAFPMPTIAPATPSSVSKPGLPATANLPGAVASSKATTREVRIKVSVPGEDALKIRNGELWFEHVSAMRHGMPDEISINENPWKPTWDDRISSKYTLFQPHLAPFDQSNVVVTEISGRTEIKSDLPSAENENTLTVTITDTPVGAGEYVIRIKW